MPPDLQHRQQIDRANVSVAEAATRAASDPLRPIYHLTTAANWINDPNGPIFFNNEYHMFFQHNPFGHEWGNMSWGHAVSRDLVYWEHLPIALAPTPDSCDQDGIFSGCCVVHEGTPTLVYTAVHPETQCIATSVDGMRTWQKHPQNPVIPQRPRDDLEGFRDPFLWREGDTWCMALGSGIRGDGGAVLLYRSSDLVHWEYQGPLCVGFGQNWECPNFFALDNRQILVISPHGKVRYSVGEYRHGRFEPGLWYPLDSGVFYAPNSMEDPRGRRIMWGWITGGGTPGFPWNGVLTLPRVLTLREDSQLGIEPAEELEKLRGRESSLHDVQLHHDTPLIPEWEDGQPVRGDTLEIYAEFEPGNAGGIGIEVRRSPEGEERTEILFDHNNLKLCGEPFQLLPDEETLTLRLFVDRSVIELYANGRFAHTLRILPQRNDSLDVRFIAYGANAKLKNLRIWEIDTIWKN